MTITYARSRLWLGISGVGALVVISTMMLVTGWPLRLLPDGRSWTVSDFAGLLAVIACLVLVMAPLDLLGGYLLPNRSRPGTVGKAAFLTAWVRGVLIQSVLFLSASLVILAAGRLFGSIGASFVVLAIGLFHVAFQLPIARWVAKLKIAEGGATLDAALQQTSAWGYRPQRVVILEHEDTGFTGGVVGLPGMESIVIPESSVNRLPPDQLAATIARRMEAIRSGSRLRGVAVAFAWVTVGFVLSASLPGAGVTSVGELVMTYLGFTLWTFLGLLTLPTLSRQASYAIDSAVVAHGVSKEVLSDAIGSLDKFQDDEPERPALIETIFHPVPSVGNRQTEMPAGSPIAWHAARMTLFVSWACSGMLVRAVHCNAGRPELWVMLPTD